MASDHPRMVRERKTVEVMIKYYCRKKHSQKIKLCTDCQQLYGYAMYRLKKCTYQENKPTCANCPLHCFKEPMKNKIKTVMRFSGPRMLGRHPILAIQHLRDRKKKEKKAK